MNTLLFLAALACSVLFIRVWTGLMNVTKIEEESLAVVEKKHPYLPQKTTILLIGILSLLFIALSLRYSSALPHAIAFSHAAVYRTIFVFLAIAAFGAFDQWKWRGSADRYKYFFAFVLGTVVTWILIGFKRAFFETGIQHDPFLMALGISCVVVGWRFLFGPWNASIKSTVLGTFIFWVAYAVLRHETSDELLATAIAGMTALVPLVIWSVLFLRQHRERLSIVLLALFAGMISTVPILFYDALLTHSVQFNFFFFRIVLQDLGSSAGTFARQETLGHIGLQSGILAGLITYLLVGVIEEGSKYWLFRHSSDSFFRSIDDALQLAILVAIGFAFAENLENPSYFVGFVKTYLLEPSAPQWLDFFGNVVGRSVLTTMVHIVSTGVMGYFVGVAAFASPLLKDQFIRGKIHPIIEAFHRFVALRPEAIFSRYYTLVGLLCAVLLHGLFDFAVSLPEFLPGNPSTIGGMLNLSPDSFLGGISIVLLPSLLYVVGGFWLLLYLFERKEDMKEYGAIITTQVVVREMAA